MKELFFQKSSNFEARWSNSAGVYYENHNSIYLFGGLFDKQKIGDLLWYDLTLMTVEWILTLGKCNKNL